MGGGNTYMEGGPALETDLTQVLTTEIRNLIEAKEALDAMSDERKGLQERAKNAKERILKVMVDSNIDKANFEQYAVSVATSNRKETINSKNLHEILKRVVPDKDADELAPKILQSLGATSQPFIRMSKSATRR